MNVTTHNTQLSVHSCAKIDVRHIMRFVVCCLVWPKKRNSFEFVYLQPLQDYQFSQFYFQLSLGLTENCLRFTFVYFRLACNVVMNFYIFVPFISFASCRSRWEKSICTPGLSFLEIFAIWFLCVSALLFQSPHKGSRKHFSGPKKEVFVSSPLVALGTQRLQGKLIFRRIFPHFSISHFTLVGVRLFFSFWVSPFVSWKFEYFVCCRRRRSFLLIIFPCSILVWLNDEKLILLQSFVFVVDELKREIVWVIRNE